MTNLQPFAENDRQLAPVTWQGGPSTGDLDYALPRLILMQAGSPQLQSHPGVQAGQLLHSVTGEVFDAVSVCNVAAWRDYVLFRRRELGGGYVDTFKAREDAEAALREMDENPLDYEIVDTAKHLCLLLGGDSEPQPVLLFLARSQHRFSRCWNTQLQLAYPGGERWSSRWQLHPVRQQNSKGSWFTLAASLEGVTDEATRAAAERLAATVS
mgnify:CR=1 FL=1